MKNEKNRFVEIKWEIFSANKDAMRGHIGELGFDKSYMYFDLITIYYTLLKIKKQGISLMILIILSLLLRR